MSCPTTPTVKDLISMCVQSKIIKNVIEIPLAGQRVETNYKKVCVGQSTLMVVRSF